MLWSLIYKKLNMNNEIKAELLEFLKEFKKSDKVTWVEIYNQYPYKGSLLTSKQKSDSVRKLYKKQMNKDTNTITSDHQHPEGFRVKKAWQSGNGTMLYSYIAEDDEVLKEDYDRFIEDFRKHLSTVNKKAITYKQNSNKVGVVTIADLHVGAYIRSLIKTQDYDLSILTNYLEDIVNQINDENFKEVHLSFLGDFIESFTGKNHLNSWKEIAYNQHGANVIKIVYELLIDFCSKINNLSKIYIVSGNHDRLHENKEMDMQGGASELIAYFLNEKLDVEIKFHPILLSESIDGIRYIFTHGHFAIAKQNLPELLFKYGKQDEFNILIKGHLHTRQSQRKSINTDFIQMDGVNYRGYTCPSLFTGNFYSESGGWTSTPGFYMFYNNNNKPKLIDITL